MSSATLTRRAALGLFLSTAGTVVLAACGAGAQQAVSPPASAPPTSTAGSSGAAVAGSAAAKPSAQPKNGGTLRVGSATDITNLDATTGGSVYQIYDRLIAYNDKLQPQPAMADSWDVAPDAKSVTFKLKPGVTFHDGREATSADWVYSLDRFANHSYNQHNAVQAKWFTADAPDKTTVIFKSDTPRPTMFDFFEYFNVVDKNAVEAADAKSRANGTGPFMLAEWLPGDHLFLKKNPNYWNKALPHVDTLELHVAKDFQGMVATFEAGATDVMATPPLPDFARLKGDPKYQVFLNNDTGNVNTIGLSVNKPPFDNLDVRAAFNYAIDRQRYVNTVSLGTAVTGALPWPPNSPAFDAAKNTQFTFDLDKAKALMQEANVTNLVCDCILQNSNPEESAFSQIYQADLAKIGVTMNIKGYDGATWLDIVNNVKYFGLWLGGISYAQLEPSTTFADSRGMNPTLNSSGYRNDEYTQLVQQSQQETDVAKRKQMYSQLNDILLRDNFLLILATAPGRVMATTKVHDVGVLLDGTFSYAATWLG